MLDTDNPDCLISISTVRTLNLMICTEQFIERDVLSKVIFLKFMNNIHLLDFMQFVKFQF